MRKAYQYIPTVLVVALITYMSLLREPRFLPTSLLAFPHSDKIIHCLMYAILTFTFSFDSIRAKIGRKTYCIGSAFIALYCGMIELLQEYFFQPRTGDWLDWLADIVGIAIIATIYLSKRPRSQ